MNEKMLSDILKEFIKINEKLDEHEEYSRRDAVA